MYEYEVAMAAIIIFMIIVNLVWTIFQSHSLRLMKEKLEELQLEVNRLKRKILGLVKDEQNRPERQENSGQTKAENYKEIYAGDAPAVDEAFNFFGVPEQQTHTKQYSSDGEENIFADERNQENDGTEHNKTLSREESSSGKYGAGDEGRDDVGPEEQAAFPQAARTGNIFERQFGGNAFVWLGGIALALAGFYMVKYSIEIGLLNPTVRLVLGFILGVAFLAGASAVRQRKNFANGTRIAQALSGAGIADLYATIFAATSLYHFLPSYLGFAGLTAVTAMAVFLSLQHGVPIAILGLIGGFLTPALVSTNQPDAPLLFIYLYVVFAGFMAIIRKKEWWFLAVPVTLAAFLWVAFWVFGGYFVPEDALWVILFLSAVCVTVVGISQEYYEQEKEAAGNSFGVASILHYIALGGALILIGLTTSIGGFLLMDWALFGLLTLAGICLAYFNPKLYGFVPWTSLLVNLVMLMGWEYNDVNEYAGVIALFSLIFTLSGRFIQSRSENQLRWAGLGAAGRLAYYLLAYVKLHQDPAFVEMHYFWGELALLFSLSTLYEVYYVMRTVPNSDPHKQSLLALYAGLTTAFISISFTIEMQREFLSVAFAAELLAICWINTRVNVRALRMIAALLAGTFGLLLVPQILLLIQLAAFSLAEARLQLQDNVPIVEWPIFQLGLPALFFLGSAYLLRQQKEDRFIGVLESSAIVLCGVMGYYLTRHAFHIDENLLFVKAGFIERGVITNVFFIYGLICMGVGRIFGRSAFSYSGLVLIGIALFRTCYFDFGINNPLWSAQAIGALPIANGLLLAYGLPMIWIGLVNTELPHLGKASWRQFGNGFIILLVFTLITMNVRQFFHGNYLNSGGLIEAEIYTYSVVWLAFGFALLSGGTIFGNHLVRTASLPVFLLTIAKVFLYDASELTGLWRVISFFGLGVCLLGLSWVYSRYVFKENTK